MHVAGYILAGIGFIFWFLGSFLILFISKSSWKNSVVTKGHIIGMCFNNVKFNLDGSGYIHAKTIGPDNVADYYPVFSYVINGKEYTKAGDIAYDGKLLKQKTGKTCTVRYDPQNPQEPELYLYNREAILGRVFAAFGFGFLMCGMLFLSIDPDTKNDIFEEQENEITENSNLSRISFNKMKIGDKADSKMLDGLVMDANYRYEYKDICFDVDGNDKINFLGFYTKSGTSEVIVGIKDANIQYKGQSLITREDFENCFGEGEVSYSEDDPEWVYITYNENGLELRLQIYKDELINVELKSR